MTVDINVAAEGLVLSEPEMWHANTKGQYSRLSATTNLSFSPWACYDKSLLQSKSIFCRVAADLLRSLVHTEDDLLCASSEWHNAAIILVELSRVFHRQGVIHLQLSSNAFRGVYVSHWTAHVSPHPARIHGDHCDALIFQVSSQGQ